MKALQWFISITISILLFLLVFFTSMELVIYNTNYYEGHYKERNIMEETNMSLDDLMKVTINILDYLKDDRDTLNMTAVIDGKEQEVFGEREKQHMVDVKDLFIIGTYLRNISLIIIIIALALIIWKKRSLLTIVFSSVKYVFSFIIMLILILGTLLYIDFNKYFTIFHKIFFANDLWILDPKTDILINMVPEVFFYITAILILLIFVIVSVLLIFIAERLKKKLSTQ